VLFYSFHGHSFYDVLSYVYLLVVISLHDISLKFFESIFLF
jgi:hypothetical protein